MPETLDHSCKRLLQLYPVLEEFLRLLPWAFLLVAHLLALLPAHLLALITIIWLPIDTKSYYQLLDQGIIAKFKLYYYKMWIVYMIREYEAE